MKTNNGTNDEWWTSLSNGEKNLIRTLMQMVQGAKNSEVIEVARAARKWESGLSFFFKVRLKNQRPRLRGAFNPVYLGPNVHGNDPAISSPSTAHSQEGAAPSRG